jgi:hypothetical protein
MAHHLHPNAAMPGDRRATRFVAGVRPEGVLKTVNLL